MRCGIMRPRGHSCTRANTRGSMMMIFDRERVLSEAVGSCLRSVDALSSGFGRHADGAGEGHCRFESNSIAGELVAALGEGAFGPAYPKSKGANSAEGGLVADGRRSGK